MAVRAYIRILDNPSGAGPIEYERTRLFHGSPDRARSQAIAFLENEVRENAELIVAAHARVGGASVYLGSVMLTISTD
jgi:hypothetical protein